jgi:transcriptional regulator with XRE-family HTH domain
MMPFRKAFGETLRKVRLEKGLSLEQADAILQAEIEKDTHWLLSRALGIVVRRLREQQKMSRAQLSSASGLPVRLIINLERGKEHYATMTDIARISLGLNHPVTDLVDQVEALEKELRSE